MKREEKEKQNNQKEKQIDHDMIVYVVDVKENTGDSVTENGVPNGGFSESTSDVQTSFTNCVSSNKQIIDGYNTSSENEFYVTQF